MAGHWQVDALGAPHIGERSEKALIAGFVNRIASQRKPKSSISNPR
jgi:hypothetical protein